MRSFQVSLAALFLSLLSPAFSHVAQAGPAASEIGLSADPARATYAEVQAYLRGLVQRFPQNARLVTVGDSDSGQKIEGLALGNGPVKNLIVAAHHGNEYGSVETARAAALSFAEHPIPGQTVYVIPVLNIAGYNAKQRRESGSGRSWDPNRNYPGPCGSEGQLELKSTRSLAEFIDREGIVTSATMHTFAPAVMYPWGISTHDLSTPYDDLFKSLVEAATIESHYKTGNSTEILYPANGAFEDYAYWKHGIWSILFEVGMSHSPSLPKVIETAQVNVPGLRRMFAQAPTTRAEDHGFKGKCSRQLMLLDRHEE